MSPICANENITSYNQTIENTDSNDFTYLTNLINNSSDEITLEQNYSSRSNEYITISKSITINGNNNTIENNNKNTSFFKIDNNNISLTLKNIHFKNVDNNINFLSIDNHENINITLINCYFPIKHSNELFISSLYEKSHTGTVSPVIKKLVKKIVGNSKDMDAAKKLANWVSKNIKHETKAGFYQSPVETLNRKLGNCACQANLFLQMCEAAGVTKTCKVYFVHIGQMKPGHRHFFTIINNLCVDVDRNHAAWGHASGLSLKTIYQITRYPILPLEKKY